MNTPHGLDIEIVMDKEDGEWQVWTAGHRVGAIIGTGATVREAMRDALANMEVECEKLRKEIAAP